MRIEHRVTNKRVSETEDGCGAHSVGGGPHLEIRWKKERSAETERGVAKRACKHRARDQAVFRGNYGKHQPGSQVLDDDREAVASCAIVVLGDGAEDVVVVVRGDDGLEHFDAPRPPTEESSNCARADLVRASEKVIRQAEALVNGLRVEVLRLFLFYE